MIKFLLFNVVLLFNCVSPIQGNILGQTAPADYFLTCDPDSFAFIYENFELDHYIPCILEIDGQEWSDCRVRIRGDSSREFPKKSLKIKTDGALFPNGNDVINFNSAWADRSYLRVVLATRFFQRAGVPCFKAAHARLHLNGGYLGLYLEIQNMDEVFLAENGLDPGGNLYKATTDGASLTRYEPIHEWWEKKTNSQEAWTDLEDLIDDLATVPAAEFAHWATENTDLEELSAIFACNALLANGSTYYHNYYMYHDINGSGLWSMLPWDVDKTFASYGSDYPYHKTSHDGWHDNPLPERWYIDPMTFDRFEAKVTDLILDTFNGDFFFPMMDSLQTVLAASVLADTTDNVTDLAQWMGFIETEKSVGIEDRALALANQLSEMPRSFQVEAVPHALQDSVPLHWSASLDPNGDELTYTVRHSTDSHYLPETTVSYPGIVDTTFTLPDPLPEGKYYWQVLANDGNPDHAMTCYDSFNRFEIAHGTQLPALIHRDRVLNHSGSPYFINGDMTVASGAVLRLEPGTVVHVSEGSQIDVEGRIEAEGTVYFPVQFLQMLGQGRWGALCFNYADTASTLKNVVFSGASLGILDWQKSAVSAKGTDLDFENVTFDDCLKSIYSFNADLSLRDCQFLASNLDETLIAAGGEALVQNCTFWKTGQEGDALDFDGIDRGLITGCRFYGDGGGDDLIDLGSYCDSLTISDNLILGAVDKGVSLGEGSRVVLKGNVIAGCLLAVAVKDNSFCLSQDNTFYGNGTAISLYEKTNGWGGGQIEIVNTILSNSETAALSLDELSAASLRYSLCDTENLEGEGNVFADPMLMDPEQWNWGLSAGSPCIDAGDPLLEPDPDGTPADIGARFFNQAHFRLVINEINYNSSPTFDPGDWVEVYNPTEVSVDMSGLKFKDSNHSFLLPAGLTIEPQGYLVLAENRAAFLALFPDVVPVQGDLDFGFSGSGEILQLTGPLDEVYDTVLYDDSDPWPEEPDGNGPTLELIQYEMDNSLPSSWATSAAHGTPGGINGATSLTAVQGQLRVSFAPAYPNPFNPVCSLKFSLERQAEVDLSVFDIRGRKLVTLLSGLKASGEYSVTWDARTTEGRRLASGVYFARLVAEEKVRIQKITLVK